MRVRVRVRVCVCVTITHQIIVENRPQGPFKSRRTGSGAIIIIVYFEVLER